MRGKERAVLQAQTWLERYIKISVVHCNAMVYDIRS